MGTDDRPLESASGAVWICAVGLTYSWRMTRIRRNGTTPADHASSASEVSAGPEEGVFSPWREERRSGRPMKYSPDLALQIANEYTRGDVTLAEVLAAHGISRSAGWRWRKRYGRFRVALHSPTGNVRTGRASSGRGFFHVLAFENLARFAGGENVDHRRPAMLRSRSFAQGRSTHTLYTCFPSPRLPPSVPCRPAPT